MGNPELLSRRIFCEIPNLNNSFKHFYSIQHLMGYCIWIIFMKGTVGKSIVLILPYKMLWCIFVEYTVFSIWLFYKENLLRKKTFNLWNSSVSHYEEMEGDSSLISN